MKILIADDERDICEAVRRIVERAGHTCIEVYDGALALEAYERERPDLVIVDVMMPEVNGFDLCRDLRARDARVPIIMLSAKSDIVDKGVGFAAGCDDYVAKPFNSQELAMRIEAQLRRVRLAGDEAPRRSRAVVKVGDMEVRLKRNEVLVRGGYVNLTPKEFQILSLMADNPGRVFTRDDLIEALWGQEYENSNISIPVYIRRIRMKIEPDPSNPVHLKTVWRFGYRLE